MNTDELLEKIRGIVREEIDETIEIAKSEIKADIHLLTAKMVGKV